MSRIRSDVHYSVRPRYSCGSPALVDEATAKMVAKDEWWGYRRAVEGLFGPERAEQAKARGVGGIVEYHDVRAHHIEFYDHMNGDVGVLKDGKRTVRRNDPGLIWPDTTRRFA